MIEPRPLLRGEWLDSDEQHLLVTVGESEITPYAQLRADRGDKCVEVTISETVFNERFETLWEDIREYVEGHLKAKLPHPDVTATWWRKGDQIGQAFMPYEADEYAYQVGWCL